MNDPNATDDLRADLAALKKVSHRDLPDLKHVMNEISRRDAVKAAPIMGWRRRIMAAVQTMKARPALAGRAFCILNRSNQTTGSAVKGGAESVEAGAGVFVRRSFSQMMTT